MTLRLCLLVLLAGPAWSQAVEVTFHTVPDGCRIFRLSSAPGAGDFLGSAGQAIPLVPRSNDPIYVRLEADGYASANVLVGPEAWRAGRWPVQGAWELQPVSASARAVTAWRHFWPALPVLGVGMAMAGIRLAKRRGELQAAGAHLSAPVLEALLRGGDGTLEARTMLVSDVADFSTVCEGQPAATVAARLDDHYREMTAVLRASGGAVVHFVGDQFVVLFEGENHALRALEAARGMLARLAELERQDPSGQSGFYRVRIGLHSGLMGLQRRQSETRVDVAVVGPAAREAYQVQEETREHGVSLLISEDTARLVGSRCPLVAHGSRFAPVAN